MSGSPRQIRRRKMREAGLLPRPGRPPLTPEQSETIAACRLLVMCGLELNDANVEKAREACRGVADRIARYVWEGSTRPPGLRFLAAHDPLIGSWLGEGFMRYMREIEQKAMAEAERLEAEKPDWFVMQLGETFGEFKARILATMKK